MANKIQGSYSFPFKACQSVFIMLSDKIGEDREQKDLHEMIEKINKIANEYDFNIEQFGNAEFAQKAMQYLQWKLNEPDLSDNK